MGAVMFCAVAQIVWQIIDMCLHAVAEQVEPLRFTGNIIVILGTSYSIYSLCSGKTKTWIQVVQVINVFILYLVFFIMWIPIANPDAAGWRIFLGATTSLSILQSYFMINEVTAHSGSSNVSNDEGEMS